MSLILSLGFGYHYTLNSKTRNLESDPKFIDNFILNRPHISSAYLDEEAGISAYFDLNKDINLNTIKLEFKKVLEETSEYIIGTLSLPDLPESDDTICYVYQNGTVYSFYFKNETASKIIDWNFYSSGILSKTKLLEALEIIANVYNESVEDVKYCHFQHKDAKKLMIVMEDAVNYNVDSFNIYLPSNLTYYEKSWNHNGVNNNIGNFSNELSPDEWHEVTVTMKIDGVDLSDVGWLPGGIAWVGVAIVYDPTSPNTEIQVEDADGMKMFNLNQKPTVKPSGWGIDQNLFSLINTHASDYYQEYWNLTLSQYKSWIALISLRESGLGRYAAHSQYGCGFNGDKFNHNDIGEAFPFSTGLGAFQLDRGGTQGDADENWGTMPTINKLDPEISLLSTLRWHRDRFNWNMANLSDFSRYSAWYAVQPINKEDFSITWQEITGKQWEQCKNREIEVDFNPPLVNDPFEQNIQFICKLKWNLTNFDGYYDTWLINSRSWSGEIVTQYYYTYRQDIGYEIWVYNDPEEKLIFRYERNFTTGPFPENRIDVGCPSIAGLVGDSAALDPNDCYKEVSAVYGFELLVILTLFIVGSCVFPILSKKKYKIIEKN